MNSSIEPSNVTRRYQNFFIGMLLCVTAMQWFYKKSSIIIVSSNICAANHYSWNRILVVIVVVLVVNCSCNTSNHCSCYNRSNNKCKSIGEHTKVIYFILSIKIKNLRSCSFRILLVYYNYCRCCILHVSCTPHVLLFLLLHFFVCKSLIDQITIYYVKYLYFFHYSNFYSSTISFATMPSLES